MGELYDRNRFEAGSSESSGETSHLEIPLESPTIPLMSTSGIAKARLSHCVSLGEYVAAAAAVAAFCRRPSKKPVISCRDQRRPVQQPASASKSGFGKLAGFAGSRGKGWAARDDNCECESVGQIGGQSLVAQ